MKVNIISKTNKPNDVIVKLNDIDITDKILDLTVNLNPDMKNLVIITLHPDELEIDGEFDIINEGVEEE